MAVAGEEKIAAGSSGPSVSLGSAVPAPQFMAGSHIPAGSAGPPLLQQREGPQLGHVHASPRKFKDALAFVERGADPCQK